MDPNEMTVIVDALTKITSGTDTRDDWEILFEFEFKDQRAEAIQQLCQQLSEVFPGEWPKYYSARGMEVLSTISNALKDG